MTHVEVSAGHGKIDVTSVNHKPRVRAQLERRHEGGSALRHSQKFVQPFGGGDFQHAGSPFDNQRELESSDRGSTPCLFKYGGTMAKVAHRREATPSLQGIAAELGLFLFLFLFLFCFCFCFCFLSFFRMRSPWTGEFKFYHAVFSPSGHYTQSSSSSSSLHTNGQH
jgi:hypothetical protein